MCWVLTPPNLLSKTTSHQILPDRASRRGTLHVARRMRWDHQLKTQVLGDKGLQWFHVRKMIGFFETRLLSHHNEQPSVYPLENIRLMDLKWLDSSRLDYCSTTSPQHLTTFCLPTWKHSECQVSCVKKYFCEPHFWIQYRSLVCKVLWWYPLCYPVYPLENIVSDEPHFGINFPSLVCIVLWWTSLWDPVSVSCVQSTLVNFGIHFTHLRTL